MDIPYQRVLISRYAIMGPVNLITALFVRWFPISLSVESVAFCNFYKEGMTLLDYLCESSYHAWYVPQWTLLSFAKETTQ